MTALLRATLSYPILFTITCGMILTNHGGCGSRGGGSSGRSGGSAESTHQWACTSHLVTHMPYVTVAPSYQRGAYWFINQIIGTHPGGRVRVRRVVVIMVHCGDRKVRSSSGSSGAAHVTNVW